MAMQGKLKAWSKESGRKTLVVLLRAANATPGVAGAQGDALCALGTVVPAGAKAGFSKGCAFFLTDSVTGLITAIYGNAGTNLSSNFVLTSA